VNDVILVIDSGLGGISVLRSLCTLAPQNYVYFADYLHHPYGDKASDEVQEIIVDLVSKYKQKFNVKGIVLACNTATTLAIKPLRNKFSNLKIVGTEPAIKCAISDNKSKILLLATQNTIKFSNVVSEMIKKYPQRIIVKIMPSLASDVENNISNLSLLKTKLKNELSEFVGKIDSLVLGCTHYIFLKPVFKQIFGQKVVVYDGNLGVAKQCRKIWGITSSNSVLLITNVPTKRQNLIKAWNIIGRE